MNAIEIKQDIYRKIDNLKDAELERVYKALLTILNPPKKYTLTHEERLAVEEALECSRQEENLAHESVMKEAKAKYSKLNFK
jgi:hypothetical protein